MSDKNHSHNCGGGGHHEHDHADTPEMGIEYSLYTKIDFENMECLNEQELHSGRSVFKPWEDRFDLTKFVESDVDEELLFNIPFTGNVKLKGIILMGNDNDNSHPSRMRLFKNREKMSFDDVAIEADQEFELHPDSTGRLEYPIKVVKFSSIYHLTIHFPRNFGAEATRLSYIGLRGEFSPAHRHGVTICTYEARPNVADHKASNDIVTHHVI